METQRHHASLPARAWERAPLGERAPSEGEGAGGTHRGPFVLPWLFLSSSPAPGGLVGFSPAGLFSRSAPRVQTTCREATAERRQPARRQPPPRSAGEGKLGLKKSSARRRYRGRADGAARASREELLVLPIREHMGRLRCPPPPAHGPSARCWGAWKEPPRGEQPPPRSEGRGAGARRFGGTTPSRAAPSAPAPTRAPAAPACL